MSGHRCASRPTPQLAKLTPRASRADPAVQRAEAAARTRRSPPDGPIEHVFYIVRENRTYDQILGDDPRGDGDPKLTALRRGHHAERPRARQALPAARPRLRELRGLDRRPLLDLGRRGLRLRRQELAPELRRPRAPLRLRRLLGHLAGARASSSTRPRSRASPSSTTARRSPAPCRSPTSTARRRRPRRSPRSSRKSDLGPLAPGPQLRPAGALLLQRRRSGGETSINGQEVFDSTPPGGRQPADDREPLRVLPAALRPAARDGLACRRSTTSSSPTTTPRAPSPGRPHAARDDRRQRPRPRARSST